MTYEIDSQGRIWLNDGVIVEGCGQPWDDYILWRDLGNTPKQRQEQN